MAATPHDGSGTTLTFDGDAYTVTNIVVTNSNPNTDNPFIDISHLGLTSGASILTMDRPLKGSATDTGQQVQIDYIGKSILADSDHGTLVLQHNGSTLLSRAATVMSSTLTFSTNDVVRGSATFKIARNDYFMN